MLACLYVTVPDMTFPTPKINFNCPIFSNFVFGKLLFFMFRVIKYVI